MVFCKMDTRLKYPKLVMILCFWGLAGSGYFLWYYLAQRYVHMWSNPFVQAQREPVTYVSSHQSALPIQSTKETLNSRVQNLKEMSSSTGTQSEPSPGKGKTEIAVTLPTHSNVSESFQQYSVTSAEVSVANSTPSINYTTQASSLVTKMRNIPTDSPSPKLLCVYFTGRLGNELFEYASILALSVRTNHTPVFLYSKHLRTVLASFAVSPSNLSQAELQQHCRKARVFREESCCKFQVEMTQLDPRYDYHLSQYLQSYRYFDNYQAMILKAVTFKDMIRSQANKTVQELRQQHKSCTLVGVHIRHGDMATKQLQNLGYPVASPDYINKSLSYFSQLYPNCVFVVASDSVQWCKENFPKGYNVTYLNGNEPAVDMLILASLDHVIISFGSFSWWIGYLSHGRVVYMKDFIRVNTLIGNCFHPKGRDYIYPGWIPL